MLLSGNSDTDVFKGRQTGGRNEAQIKLTLKGCASQDAETLRLEWRTGVPLVLLIINRNSASSGALGRLMMDKALCPKGCSKCCKRNPFNGHMHLC